MNEKLTGVRPFPKTSEDASASSPSEEFPFTWVSFGNDTDYGMFYRNPQAAIDAARDNFHNFPDGMFKNLNCFLVKVVSILN